MILLLIFSLTIKIFDVETNLPLKDAVIYCGKKIYFTDENGLVEIKEDVGEIIIKMTGYKEKKVYLKRDINYLEIGLEPEYYEMEVIEVKGGYSLGEEESETITKREIILSPGSAVSLLWTIKDLPSIQGTEDVAPLEVRGGDPKETEVYIENARIKSPYVIQSPAGGLFSFIKTDFIKSADFFPGGFDARYEGGMSGALSINLMDELKSEGNINLNISGASLTYSLPFLMFTLDREDPKYAFLINKIEKDVIAPKVFNLQILLLKPFKIFNYFVNEKDRFSLKELGIDKNYEENGNRSGIIINNKNIFKNLGLNYTFYFNYDEVERKIEGIFKEFKKEKSGGIYLNTYYKNYEFGIDGYLEKDKILSLFTGNNIKLKNFEIKPSFRFTFFNFKEFYFSPRLNAFYIPFKNFSINFGTGVYKQYPELKPYSIHYQSGLETLIFKNNIFKFDIYYKTYKKLPFENDGYKGYGESYGLEIYLKNKYSPLSFSYSFMVSKRNVDTSGFTYYNNDVRHKITFISSFLLPYNLTFGIKIKYNTGLPYTPLLGFLEDTIPIWGKKNSARFPYYLRIDIRITKFFTIFNYPFFLYIECLNITNNKNIIKKLYSYDYKTEKDLILIPRFFVIGFVYKF